MPFVKHELIDDRIIIHIQGIDLSVINSLRRVLISDIPVLGVIGEGNEVSVSITENETKFSNEFISHRIGLIPLHLSMADIEKYSENGLTMKIDIKNKQASKQTMTVTTEHIDLYNGENKLSDNERNKILPPFVHNNDKYNSNTIYLDYKKRLALTAHTFIKTGIYHANFTAVSGPSVYFDFDNNDTSKDPIEREMSYYKNKDGSPKTIKLGFEIINGYTFREIIDKAISVLIEKLNNLVDAVTKNDRDVLIYSAIMNETSMLFMFKGETHTTGNIIQSYFHKKYVLDQKNKLSNGKKCLYAGYNVPDPVYDVMEFRFTLENTTDAYVFNETFKIVVDELIVDLRGIQEEWNAYAKLNIKEN